MEPDHVEQRHCTDRGATEVGSLGDGGADEQPTVRAAADRELFARRDALGDEPVAGGVEVVEHLLLVLAHAARVPRLALLAPPRMHATA